MFHVLYGGTEEQWEAIEFGEKNESFRKRVSHYGSTGDEITAERTAEPTCTEKGSITYTCSLCEESVTYSIAEKGHIWQDATCTEPKTCTVCHETEGEALGHCFESAVKEPTCTEDGCTVNTCTVCGHEETTDIVTAPGHSYGEWTQVKAPTETEEGLSQRVCGACGEAEEQSIEKLPPAEPEEDPTIMIIVIVVIVVLGAAAAAVVLILRKKKQNS